MKKSSYRRIKNSHSAALVSSVLLSISFLLMKPVTQLPDVYANWMVPVLGLVFWLSVINAFIFILRSNILGGRYKKDNQDLVFPVKRVFFSNTAAVFADLLLIISILAAAALFAAKPENQYFYFFALAALSLAICFHFIFNGSAYQLLRVSGKRVRNRA